MTGEIKAYNGVDFRSNKGINAADPTSAQDVATKAYVDAHASSPTPTRIAANVIYSIADDTGVVMGWVPKVEAGAQIKLGINSILKVG